MTATDIDRFMSKVAPEPNSGCWLWTAAANSGGYATFRALGRTQRAHRWLYENTIGAISPGLQLDHKCRVRCCVNPDHLEPVTNLVNTRRGIGGKTTAARQRAKTHCPYGHAYSPENTLIRPTGARRCRECKRIDNRRRRSLKALSSSRKDGGNNG